MLFPLTTNEITSLRSKYRITSGRLFTGTLLIQSETTFYETFTYFRQPLIEFSPASRIFVIVVIVEIIWKYVVS